MADYISQVTLPDNQTYYLSIPYVTGTGTTAGTWTGNLPGLTAYYDGLTILYKSPVAGSTTTTLNLNGIGAKICYLNDATLLTTHYPANQPFILIYSENKNNGCWTASDYNYNKDTRDAGYGKLSIQPASTSDGALTSNTAVPAAKTYNETLKVFAGNKWINLAGLNSGTAGSDEFKIGHALSGVSSGTSSPNSAQTPGYGDTFNVPVITVDAAGHVTSMGTTTVKIPASDNVDEKVKQSPITATTSAEYNILLKNSTNNNEETAAVKFANNTNKQVTINPSTGKITAPGGLEGTASKATADASGNTITTTYAPLISPSLTGTPLAPTAPNGTSSMQIATTEFVNNTLSYINAMVFKGTLGTGGTIASLPATHEAGWTYKVITEDTYAGMKCQEGDLIICIADGTVSSNSDWTSVQVNDDRLVTGPSSSTDGYIAVFSGTAGNIIKSGETTIANATVNKANEWVNPRTVYVALNTADKNVIINGDSSSSAAAIALGVDGQLNVGNGGTGKHEWTPNGILYADAANSLSQITEGSSNNNTFPLISYGTSAPNWYSGLTLVGSDTSTYVATFKGTTDSGNSSQGAVVVLGGMGISKTLNVGTGIQAGNIQISTASSGTASRTITTSADDLIINAPSSQGIIFTQAGVSKINLVGNTFYPTSNEAGSLGTSSYAWGDIYAKKYHGTLDGSATSWTNDRKVYVALNTQSTTAVINGNASSTAAAVAIGVDGTLGVGNGGTGATSFSSGELLIGNGSSAIGTRKIYDRTSINALTATATWTNSTAIPTLNTLRYWDGRYQTTNNLSALAYCNHGAFGTMAIEDATSYIARGGGSMTGTLTVKGLKGTSNVDYGAILPQSPTEGQIFFQISDPWYELPAGGTAGQVLVKASSVDRDVTWGEASGGGILRPDTQTTYYVCGSSTSTENTDPALFDTSIYVTGSVLFGAAWNDYAEYRHTVNKIEPGRCVVEDGFDSLVLSSERMQAGAEIVSDTFGFAIGQTEKCQTPIAVTGRVLAYPYEDIDKYKPGMPVCSGPNGTVSLMTEAEARNFPWLIIGTVSAIPQEKTWGTNNVSTENRIWIRVR